MNVILRIVFRIIPNPILRIVLPRLRPFHFFEGTRNTQCRITFDSWYHQKVLGHFNKAHWPIHKTSTVINSKNIYCGVEAAPGAAPGNYIQAIGPIYIGDYTQIGPNVGIISANHNVLNPCEHTVDHVYIGRYCWIGMNSVILPGVKLGDHTIVGAGSIVTRSFEDGYQVLGGNPARLIRSINPKDCVEHTNAIEYHGYVTHQEFEKNYQKYTNYPHPLPVAN